MIRPTPEFLSLLENKCIEILVKTFVRYSGLKVEVTQVNDDIPQWTSKFEHGDIVVTVKAEWKERE